MRNFKMTVTPCGNLIYVHTKVRRQKTFKNEYGNR